MKNIESRATLVNERVAFLRSMNNIMCCLNNEELYEWWIMVFPDEPTSYDFIDVANDDEGFEHTVSSFLSICKAARTEEGGGFYIHGARAFGVKEV